MAYERVKPAYKLSENCSYEHICHSDCETDHLQSKTNSKWQLITLNLLPLKRRCLCLCKVHTLLDNQLPLLPWIWQLHGWNCLWTQASLNEKFVCDTKLHNCRTEQTASERTFASFSSDISLHFTFNLPMLFPNITAALLIKRVITVTWCCVGRCSSLLSDGISILVWTRYKCVKG